MWSACLLCRYYPARRLLSAWLGLGEDFRTLWSGRLNFLISQCSCPRRRWPLRRGDGLWHYLKRYYIIPTLVHTRLGGLWSLHDGTNSSACRQPALGNTRPRSNAFWLHLNWLIEWCVNLSHFGSSRHDFGSALLAFVLLLSTHFSLTLSLSLSGIQSVSWLVFSSVVHTRSGHPHARLPL